MAAAWPAILGLLCLLGVLPTAARADGPDLAAAETVYRWSTQRCSDDWIPDSPARAWRRDDGSIVLVAAHYTNGVLTGPDFDNLQPECRENSRGREDPDPAAFDDRYWVQALLPTGSGRLLAIGSHEFMGGRHPGRCPVQDSRRPRCWYSALILLESDQSALAFRPLPAARRILAAPPRRFDPTALGRTGFFATTNIVRSGDWLYLLAWMETPEAQGHCLFRAPATSPEGPWTALRDGAFSETFPSAYAAGETGRRCDIIGRGSLRNILRSVVWLEESRRWAGVFHMPPGHGVPEGIHVVTSPDLITWSAPRLLVSTAEPQDGRGCRIVYQYPSLIAHDSRSSIFDTAGEGLHLYLTRFNFESCRAGLNRDLIRLPVRIPD